MKLRGNGHLPPCASESGLSSHGPNRDIGVRRDEDGSWQILLNPIGGMGGKDHPSPTLKANFDPVETIGACHTTQPAK